MRDIVSSEARFGNIDALVNNEKQQEIKESYPFVICYLLVCVLGLLGNLLAIFLNLAVKEYKRATINRYALHLAFADLLFLLTLPFKVHEKVIGEWSHSEWLCTARFSIKFINYYASILFLMIMAADRYIAVRSSPSNILQKLRSEMAISVLIATTWLAALLLSTPVMLYSAKAGIYPNCQCEIKFPEMSAKENCLREGFSQEELTMCLNLTKTFNQWMDGSKHCRNVNNTALQETLYPFYLEMENVFTMSPLDFEMQQVFNDIYNETYGNHYDYELFEETAISNECHYWNKPRSWTFFIVINFTVMYLLPLMMMIVCYGLIIHKLIHSRKELSNSPKSHRDSRRLTILGGSLVTVFGLCWLPFHANHIAKLDGIRVFTIEKNKLCTILPNFSTLLIFLKSALNPFLYSFLGKTFARRWHKATSSARHFIKFGECFASSDQSNSSEDVGSIRSNGNLERAMTKVFSSNESLSKTNKTNRDPEVHQLHVVTQVRFDSTEYAEVSSNDLEPLLTS